MKTIVNPNQQRLFDPFEGVIGPTEWNIRRATALRNHRLAAICAAS